MPECRLSCDRHRAKAVYRAVVNANANAHSYSFAATIRSLSTEAGSARCSHVRTVTETFLRFLFPCHGLLHVRRNTGRTDYRETRCWLAGDKVT